MLYRLAGLTLSQPTLFLCIFATWLVVWLSLTLSQDSMCPASLLLGWSFCLKLVCAFHFSARLINSSFNHGHASAAKEQTSFSCYSVH
jgi:hypothetical protein